MAAITLTYLSGPDIDRLAMTDEEIMAAVEDAMRAQGEGRTVLEPRVHLKPDPAVEGHFNVLRGYVAPLGFAGVKVVGDFVNNYKLGLPSEMALLLLLDPATGMPKAILDATAITDMRTGAMTAIGAKYLAPPRPKVLGHVGARGTSYWNVRLLDRLFGFAEIRVHSRRPESREAFAERLSRDLGKPVRATDDWRSCLEGADILVEASRLSRPEPIFKTEWIKPGALVIPYGTMSALELSMARAVQKIVVCDRGQMRAGRLGALRPHIDAGLSARQPSTPNSARSLRDGGPAAKPIDETILFWHRGLSTTDIALGAAMLAKAETLGIGKVLDYA